MKAGARRFFVLAAVAFLLGAVAPAATYVPGPDSDLVNRAPVIARARVTGSSARLEQLNGADYPFTITTFEILEMIKGDVAGSTFRLRLPGGRVGEIVSWIPGTPVFSPNQEVVLLARPAEGHPGEHHLVEFGMGRFDIVQDRAGRRFAIRPAFSPEEDFYLAQRAAAVTERTTAEGPTPLRRADSFLDALRAAATGRVMPEIAYAQPTGDVFSPRVLSLQPEWVNIGGPEPGSPCGPFPNCLFRWAWDTLPLPASPDAVVQASGTQSNLSDSSNGIAHLQNAVDQWHGVPATIVHIATTGPPSPNITVFLDATSSFDGGAAWNTPLACGAGGLNTIGLASPSGSSPLRTFKGDSTYLSIQGGQISMRQLTGAAGCYSAATFRTAVMHELGHVIGLGHPDQAVSSHSTTTSLDHSNAVMASVVPGSRPSTPQTDDTQAMQYYYGTGAGSPPTASFNFAPGAPTPGQTVNFTDTSTGGPTSWIWNFGDPSSGTNVSFFQFPSHVFASAGNFIVALTAGNGFGSTQTTRLVIVSAGGTAPTAAFTFFPTSPRPAQAVAFTDTSAGGPTSWSWNFGDPSSGSNVSLLQNPPHTYAAVGTYTVTLTAGNSSGSNMTTRSVTVANPAAPAASFNFSPAVPTPSQTVTFTDTSTGSPTSWTWTFGDGGGSSFRNPTHAYLTAGSYTVSLTATNAGGSASTTRILTVKVATPCSTDPAILPANAGHNFCLLLQARDQRTGRTGLGLAIPQNDLFGYFSIPSITLDPTNPEVFVKVLDGRAVNGNFWVFYGGMTDLEYTLTVLDFQTSKVRMYTKPAGSAAGGFDTSAFSGSSTALSPEAAKVPSPAAPLEPITSPVTTVGQALCGGDIATLCLNSSHSFSVTLAARDQRTGRTGPGQAIPQSDLFGYFSIPALTSDPQNPEVFVKLLDGRSITGSFWVFFGGLTDLEYTITVRENSTGRIKTYFKPAGSADGGFDTAAF